MTLEATITSIQQLTPDVKEFVLEAGGHIFEYEPGQHTRIRYETDAEGKGMGRPYTATTLPGSSSITLAIYRTFRAYVPGWVTVIAPATSLWFGWATMTQPAQSSLRLDEPQTGQACTLASWRL
jgi:ferredoxin-NADP reductase